MLVLLDDGINLRFHAFPDIVESLLANNDLVSKPLEVQLYVELIVGKCVPEVRIRRDLELRLKGKREPAHDAFLDRAGVGDEETRFGGVKDVLCRVDEFTDLQRGRPHRALITGNGHVLVTIVEYLVWHELAAESQEAQPDTANVETPGRCLRVVQDTDVLDVILAQAELLQRDDVLARDPDGGVNGHLELDLTGRKEGEFD